MEIKLWPEHELLFSSPIKPTSGLWSEEKPSLQVREQNSKKKSKSRSRREKRNTPLITKIVFSSTYGYQIVSNTAVEELEEINVNKMQPLCHPSRACPPRCCFQISSSPQEKLETEQTDVEPRTVKEPKKASKSSRPPITNDSQKALLAAEVFAEMRKMKESIMMSQLKQRASQVSEERKANKRKSEELPIQGKGHARSDCSQKEPKKRKKNEMAPLRLRLFSD